MAKIIESNPRRLALRFSSNTLTLASIRGRTGGQWRQKHTAHAGRRIRFQDRGVDRCTSGNRQVVATQLIKHLGEFGAQVCFDLCCNVFQTRT